MDAFHCSFLSDIFSRLEANNGTAGGGYVLPALVDCHTHTVFAGTREDEFVKRIEGRSYAEIAEEGGGIRVTVEAVRAATCDELVASALPRLRRMLNLGVTTVEIKSGYGLAVEHELKMLQAIHRAGPPLQPHKLDDGEVLRLPGIQKDGPIVRLCF